MKNTDNTTNFNILTIEQEGSFLESLYDGTISEDRYYLEENDSDENLSWNNKWDNYWRDKGDLWSDLWRDIK